MAGGPLLHLLVELVDGHGTGQGRCHRCRVVVILWEIHIVEKDMVPVLLLHGLPEPHIAQLAPVEGGGVHLGWMETFTTGSGVPATLARPILFTCPSAILLPGTLLILRLVQKAQFKGHPLETFPSLPHPRQVDSASSSQLSLLAIFKVLKDHHLQGVI